MNPLCSALAQAQGKFTVVRATRINPKTNKYYASLEDMQSMAQPHLAEHQLSVVSIFEHNEKGLFLKTMLNHAEGTDYIATTIALPEGKELNDALINYFRSKQYELLLGIVVDAQDVPEKQEDEQEEYERITEEQASVIAGEIGGRDDIARALFKSFSVARIRDLPAKHYVSIRDRIRSNKKHT